MRPGVVLLVASMGVFMAFIDDTVVGIAFPNLLRSFHHASFGELSWVLNAYNIAFAALLIPAGRLADLLGRRRLFAVGVILFTASSALCAIAPSIGTLIAARALQGVGAAVIVPASLGLVLEAHPPGKRAQAVALWAATAALAAGIGPSIGGVLVNAYDWRLVFLVNLPIGVIAWRLAGRQLVESRAPGRRQLPDLAGALVLAAAIAALTLAVVQGPVWGWTSVRVIVAVLAALAGTVIFLRRSRAHPAQVLDLELIRAPGFAVTGALTAIGSAGFFALGLANVIYLMQVWHYSPLKAGLALTPAPFVAALAAGLTGRFATGRDRRTLVFLGAVVWTGGPVVLLARMGGRPDYLGAYLPAAVLLAIGVGIAFPLVSDAAVSDAPRGRFAAASALNGAIRQVGATVGVAILAALVGHGAVAGTASAFHRGWVFSGVCFALVALGAFGLRASAVPDFGDPESDMPAKLSSVPSRPSPPRRVEAKRVQWRPESPAELLAAVPLFAELDPGVRDSLAERCDRIRVTVGDWLFRQGDPADALYIVLTGRLEVVYESPSGASERLRDLGRGSIVGELALLSQSGRSASVRCRRDAELLRLSRERFTAMLEHSPGFGAAVSRVLGAQLQRSRGLDAEPAGGAATVAIVALTAAAANGGVELVLTRELTRLSRVAHLDLPTTSELGGGVEPALALAPLLERLEREHDLVVVSTTREGSPDWTATCVRQADRVLLLVAEAPVAPEVPGVPLSLLRGCDVALLGPSEQPGIRVLLGALEPRSTHRILGASFGADVARLARRLTGRSVGLVLSGGGARGFAHIGVIEELLAAGIVIDRIGGASMGAFIGALLAGGMDAAEIDARCYEEWVRRSPLGDYRLPRHSLLRGTRARAMLERSLPGSIEDLPRSYYCVSADLIAAELVVHRRGQLASAVAASMCIPGIFPPVALGGRLLVDGGVLDNLPVSMMAAAAEGPVIASDVNEPEQRVLAPGEVLPAPTLMDTLQRLVLLGTADTAETGRRHADLYIAPEQASVGRMEFHMLDTMRESGRRATLSALESAPASLFLAS
ncbi:MAG TPA: DHA2 family efflux MFS transporter permease subunit [Solirubrobacteraceae bacterium]